MNKREMWERAKEALSNVSLKTYLYALGTIAVIVAILINVSGPGKYGRIKGDGKFYLDLNQIASDYGLDLSPDANISPDYVNGVDSNLTQDLSRSLLLTNMYLEQSGMTDPTARGKVLANIVLEYQKQAQGKVYTENDLNIIRNEDTSSVQEYYNDLNNATKNYETSMKYLNTTDVSNIYANKANMGEQDLINMKAAISANLLNIIDVNNSYINSLVSIPATRTGSTYQLQLINLIAQQNVYLRSLGYIENDPVKFIMVDGENFQNRFKSDLLSINEMFLDYFKSNGVKF